MAVIQFKRGTAEALARVNPILAVGEPAYVLGENRLKIGDGVTAWNDLLYFDADKTELRNEINALSGVIGILPEGAKSTTVVDYIDEVVSALNIGEYAKAETLTTLEEYVTTLDAQIDVLESIGAEKNVIATVDTTQFNIDDNRQLTLLAIDMSKVIGLSDALANKVNKVDGSRLITADEAAKLEKLVLGDNGEVSVSGKVSAGSVDGLADWITARAGTLKGLSENNLTDALFKKINNIGDNAEANLIDVIQVNGVALNITNKTVNIVATDVVKSSDEIKVSADGALSLGTVSTDKLVQGSDTLILNGGSATA